MQNEKRNKIRILKLWEMLRRETDETRPMGTEEIIARLAEEGISAHRTTVYDDVKLLNDCGFEVLSRRGRSNAYYVEDRSFSEVELHILLDAVQSANFISEKKTVELVDKVAALSGSGKAELLKKNIVHFNTVKSTNEHIYYTVNEIITAINSQKKIIFYYFDYNSAHERVFRRDGHHYVVSPCATVFADGRYYLIIYDKRYGKLTHYRVDRMDRVEIIDEVADLPPEGMGFDIAKHKKQLFGMYSGDLTSVTVELERSLLGEVFDRFGEGTVIVSRGEDHIRFTAEMQVSPLFFGWCCSFGEKLRVVSPESVVDSLREYTETLRAQYAKES